MSAPVRNDLLIAHAAMKRLGDQRFFINDEGHMKGPRRPEDLTDGAEVIEILQPPAVTTAKAGQYARRLRRLDNAKKKDR